MLDQLRQGAQGWVSKLLMAVLVLSFAIWGIGGFQGYHADRLASVGNAEVTVREFSRFYEQARRNSQESGREVNPEQVLSAVMTNAALDDAASEYGLGVSNDRVATEIAKNPAFQNTDGTFDRQRFAAILDNAGMNRDDFVHDVKRQLVRGQIADTVGAGLEVPQPLVAALYRLQNEERSVSFVVVDASAIQPVGAPGNADLQAYFDANKDRFRAPEYRKLGLLTLDPTKIADPASIKDEDVSAEYDRRKESLTQPERRRVEQIRFDTADAATAAFKTIEGGKTFAEAATAGGKEVTDLGVKTKAEMIDPAVAEVAFKAEVNKPMLATEGALEPSIVMVTSIEPETVTSLADAAPNIRQELAVRAARESAHDLYDKVEDERAGGATLEEAAAKLKLPYRVIDAVSADLKSPDGKPVEDIDNGAAVVKEAFESDVGVENSPVRGTGDSWVFFDVLESTPARDRTLDEVRADVVAAWTGKETQDRIAKLADSLFDRLKAGASLESVGAEVKKPVMTAEGLKRNGANPNLTENAISQAFAGPEGHVANADGVGDARILLKVDKVSAPAFFADAADSKQIQQQISQALRNDLLSTYNRQLLSSRPTSINDVAFRQLTGQAQTQ
jgi:peptidyl-prolyl cis-trans isomerase D